MHAMTERDEMATLACFGELGLLQSPMEHRQAADHRTLAVRGLEITADVDRGFEPLAGSDALVETHQRDQPIEIGLEAALVAEPLESLARARQIADHPGDP